MSDVERELRDLRRTLANLVAAIDWTQVPVFTAIRIISVPGGGAQPTEIAPSRPDRLRLQVQVSSGGPASIGESPRVAVEGGWALTNGGPPFIDDWPVCARGSWYAFATVAATIVVAETIRLPDDRK